MIFQYQKVHSRKIRSQLAIQIAIRIFQDWVSHILHISKGMTLNLHRM